MACIYTITQFYQLHTLIHILNEPSCCYEGPSLPGAGHVSLTHDLAVQTWTLLAADLRTLETFHMRCQPKILGIRWIDHISYATVSSYTGLVSVGEQIAGRHIAIFSHIARLGEEVPAH